MGARSFSLTLAFMAAAVSCVAAGETPSASPKSTPDANYIIGPGDVIQVFVWRNPELSVTVPVRPDGKVSTPLVEDLVAVGKTPEQLARDMEKVLAEYVRSPKVNIILTQPMSSSSQVKVIGEVKQPQSFAFRQGMTVLDALVQAGGPWAVRGRQSSEDHPDGEDRVARDPSAARRPRQWRHEAERGSAAR